MTTQELHNLKYLAIADTVLSFNNVKMLYNIEVELGVETRDFEHYIRESFLPIYGIEFNFIGYERHENTPA